MTKRYEFNWRIPVPEALLQGCNVDQWTEEKDVVSTELDCLFRVDEYGFFIYWKSEGNEGAVIELCRVSDIRCGSAPKDSKLLSQLTAKHGDDLESKTLTICIGDDLVNISYQNIVFPNAELVQDWQHGLLQIAHNNKMNNLCVHTNLMKNWMKIRFLVTPDNKISTTVIAKTFASGRNEKAIYQGLSDLNLLDEKWEEKQSRAGNVETSNFVAYTVNNSEVIEPDDFTFDKFYELYYKVCPRKDIDYLYRTILGGKGKGISTDKFITFLNEKQRDPRLNEILYPLYDKKRATEIIDTYEPDMEDRMHGRLTRNGFLRFLMSDENAPVFLDRLDVYMDMDQPLPHYYINSSHNTYLIGRQFGGKSSVDMYRQVLLAGCRCIELDCWDGKSDDDEPIITHGMAMCSDILFKDVIQAIQETAFITSEYPVILSFENHCCKAQQQKMARYCEDILGDLLLKEPLPSVPLEPGVCLPSPNQLRHKILLKNVRLHPEVERQELELYRKGQLVIGDEEKEDARATIVLPDSLMSEEDNNLVPTSPTEEEIPIMYHRTGSTTNVHPLLSSMVNYTQPIKFQGFADAQQKNMHYNMSSFSETTGLNFLKTQAISFVNYNKRQMSRIYPKGSRYDSSNFMPQVFWNAGCHMVSLNFQTPDLPMQLNQGKFEYNGNCGYLLKPDFMRRSDRSFDPFSESPVDGVIAAQCSVQVISGQFLSDRMVGTYVEVDMYGLPTDTIRREFRTHIVPSNGLNPIYHEEPFLFRKVVLPDLAVLRLSVYDEIGKLLGQRVLPLDGLQAGYRHISLRTENNLPLPLSMLFCNIELKIYVPDAMEDFTAALLDPRTHLWSQQMKNMDMEDPDGDKCSVPPISTMCKSGRKISREVRKVEELKLTPITSKSLRLNKTFQKLLRKQQREQQTLKKDQHKERQKVQKLQCVTIEKFIQGRNFREMDCFRSLLDGICHQPRTREWIQFGRQQSSPSPDDIISDPEVRKMVQEQTAQWSTMLSEHVKQEWELVRQQLIEQKETLFKLLELAQIAQLKELETKHHKEMQSLKSSQAKMSVESMKEVAENKLLNTKFEMDRMLRERKESNTKMFLEQRRFEIIKQDKETGRVKIQHAKQREELVTEMSHLIQMYNNEEVEYNLGPRKVAYV